MSARPAPWRLIGAVWLLSSLVIVGWLLWPASPTPIAPVPAGQSQADPSAHIERGRLLALQGNCAACHTPAGGPDYAGGVPLPTPFGTVFGGNLTPSSSGLAGWSADDFWRALHLGESRDGRLLTPAFPLNNFTHISRADSDALWAFFQQLPAVDTPSPAHELRWPYGTQAAQKVWRALFFRPADALASAPEAPDQRGIYLVNGLGHCSACHAPRNALAGSFDPLSLAGGELPNGWHAPSLLDPAEAGVHTWPQEGVEALLKHGRWQQHLSTGPMAEVVHGSLRHWPEADIAAVARHLRTLPQELSARAPAETAPASLLALGDKLYRQHCAQCHGDQGQGFALSNGEWAYPPLAGNRSVTQHSPANALHSVLHGGFSLPAPGVEQPFGMPPYVLELSDTELAALLSHLRSHWGNTAGAVSPLQVQQWRR